MTADVEDRPLQEADTAEAPARPPADIVEVPADLLRDRRIAGGEDTVLVPDEAETAPVPVQRRSWWLGRNRRQAETREADTASSDAAEAAGAAEPARRKSWREQRWERRRRRRFFEEVLGWILVPIIVLSAYWAVTAGLAAMGTSPSALIQGIQTILH
jgi:hypothetical protein